MSFNYEEIGGYTLDEADEANLIQIQIECTFVWVTKDGSQSCRFSSYAPDTCQAWDEQGACWTARDGPSDLIPVVNLNTVTSSSVPGSKFNRVRDIPSPLPHSGQSCGLCHFGMLAPQARQTITFVRMRTCQWPGPLCL